MNNSIWSMVWKQCHTAMQPYRALDRCCGFAARPNAMFKRYRNMLVKIPKMRVSMHTIDQPNVYKLIFIRDNAYVLSECYANTLSNKYIHTYHTHQTANVQAKVLKSLESAPTLTFELKCSYETHTHIASIRNKLRDYFQIWLTNNGKIKKNKFSYKTL